MENNFDLIYKTNKGNFCDLEETLFELNESNAVGRYEIPISFYNEDLHYSIVYHKQMYKSGEDYIEVWINDRMKDEIKEFWNDEELKEIVNRIEEESYTYIVNYILDKMDGFIDYLNWDKIA